MNKGQIISGEFIVSMAIFLFVIAIIVPLFNRISSDFEERQFIEDVKTRLFFTSDAILKTTGVPDDWNSTNVRSIGFANSDGRINKTKIKKFLSLDNVSARSLLGLEGYEFDISFYVNSYPMMTGIAVSPVTYFYVNDNGLFSSINNSGLTWDLYYAGSGSVPQNDARNVYTGTKQTLFNEMVGNSTKYRTVIIENPELTQEEVNINALKNFVSTGGILIYEGNAQLISTGFSMRSSTDPGRNGILKDNDFIEAPYGSVVNFTNSAWYFYRSSADSHLYVIAEHETISNAAFIGNWNHGIGRIYYITDIEGTVNGVELRKVINLVGKKAEYLSGNMSSAITASRPLVLGTTLNSLARMVMVIGK